ncbi:MAG: HAD hydrolase family protein [Lachnospiraceae bacterium]|nr:HAD hydrolase family protein [Lachnospiraceae bacterium]
MVRLIALDMDGTLLRDNKTLPEVNRRAVADAVRAGFQVIAVTGRHYAGAMRVLKDLPEIRHVITCNGAALYEIPENSVPAQDQAEETSAASGLAQLKLADYMLTPESLKRIPRAGNLLTEYPFEDEVIYPMMRKLGNLNIIVDAFCNGQAYADVRSWQLFMELDIPEPVKEYILRSRVYVDHLTDYLMEQKIHVHKLTINFPGDGHGGYLGREKTEAIAKEYGLAPVSGGVGNMELTRLDVTKGRMLLEFAEHADIRREEIMAFGDSGNDIAMLQAAGIGIAMGNASPDVKRAADRVAKSNEEGGVAVEIRNLIRDYAS